MAVDDEDDEIPPVARPDPAELDFDLDAALSAVVSIRTEIRARRLHRLGPGHRAARQWRGDRQGRADPDHRLSDHRGRAGLADGGPGHRGTGPCRRLRPGNRPRPDPAARAPADARRWRSGSCDALEPGEPLVVAGGRGPRDALSARLVAKRPVRRLLGILSRHRPVHRPGPSALGRCRLHRPGRRSGRHRLAAGAGGGARGSEPGRQHDRARPTCCRRSSTTCCASAGSTGRPAPGSACSPPTRPTVSWSPALANGGPAARAGIAEGDFVTAIDGEEIEDLGDLWRKLWAAGEAGVAVKLTVSRDGRQMAACARPPTAAASSSGRMLH